jgi:hypothetical protein
MIPISSRDLLGLILMAILLGIMIGLMGAIP